MITFIGKFDRHHFKEKEEVGCVGKVLENKMMIALLMFSPHTDKGASLVFHKY